MVLNISIGKIYLIMLTRNQKSKIVSDAEKPKVCFDKRFN